MKYADKYAAEVIMEPKSIKYHEDIRMFQGCPTIAATRGGRLFLGWYAGGTGEPRMDNYNLVVTSDDGGRTWSKPLLVIPSSYDMNIHALDIQLFIDPMGVLHIQWVQNDVKPLDGREVVYPPDQPLVVREGYIFDDFRHYSWEMVCEDPDAEILTFSEPRPLYQGFLRCKPTFLRNGAALYFAYDQLCHRYGYHRSEDGGKSFTHHYGAEKLKTLFDETMAYEREDGSIRMLARTRLGELAESISHDGGFTWSKAEPSGIVSGDSRFYIGRLPSGRLLLVTNDDPHPKRKKMTVSLSEDDGATWRYKVCIDDRTEVSYPDVDVCGERIFLTYDRERTGAREILFASFTEDDIIKGNPIETAVISKPRKPSDKRDVLKKVEEEKLIVILRNVKAERLIPLAKALWDGGIRLLEVTFSGTDRESAEKTAESIRLLCEHFGDDMMIGAGTVRTTEQVRLAAMAGARFILSPDTQKEVIRETVCYGMVSIPGAFTPTETTAALRYGADLVKIFPAESGGPSHIKAILAPLQGAKLLAVGGVDETNLSDYLAAGAIACGVGTAMIPHALVEEENYTAIASLAASYVKQIKKGSTV